MNLTTTFHVGATVLAAFALSACGQSNNDDVMAEDIFAPAVDTGDMAIDAVQTVFDDPFAAQAQLVTDTSLDGGELAPFVNDPFLEGSGMTDDMMVPVVPMVAEPTYQPTMPAQMQYDTGAPASFDCSFAPSSKSQLRLFRQYCGGAAPQMANFGGAAPQVYGGNDPAQQVFFSQSFDCSQSPSSKPELAFYRANCLSSIAAPISAPVASPVAIEPQPAFIEDFVEELVETVPVAEAPQSYDCNILPTSRAELELYQQFCG